MKFGKIMMIMAVLAMIAFASVVADDDSKYVKAEIKMSESLAGIETVKMDTLNGDIIATIGSGNEMKLTVKERVRINNRIDAKDLLAEAKAVISREGNKLVVKIDYGKFKEHKERGNFQANFIVSLPARLNVELGSTNGDIEAGAFYGEVHASTTNGDIDCAGAGKGANVSTTNGDVQVDASAGTVHASTTNGNVEVTGMASEVQASTTNGDIEVTAKISADCRFSTTMGDVILIAASGSSFKFDASTTMGDIDISGGSDVDYNKKHTHATGSFGSGTYKVKLSSTMGDVIVK
jgi:DUF4097 and DUF4098 domain-containing protein YvlB